MALMTLSLISSMIQSSTVNAGNISHVHQIRAIFDIVSLWVYIYIYTRGLSLCNCFVCVKVASWFVQDFNSTNFNESKRDRSAKCCFVDPYHIEWTIGLILTTLSSAKFVSMLSRFNLIEGEFSRIRECHEIQFHGISLPFPFSLILFIAVRLSLSKWKENRWISDTHKHTHVAQTNGPIDTFYVLRTPML